MSGVTLLDDLGHVLEGNCVVVYSHIFQHLSHISPSGFVDVGQDSVLEHSFFLLLSVGGDVLSDLISVQMLVLEHVLHLALVNGHPLFFGMHHGVVLMFVGILEGVVLLLTQLCQLNFELVGASQVDLINGSLFLIVLSLVLVLDQMHETLGFSLVKCSQEWHEILKLFLVLLVLLVLGLGIQILFLDHHFEFFARSVHIFEQFLGDVFFVVEFGDLLFGVELQELIFIPVVSGQFLE